MANALLVPIYQDVYDEEFIPNSCAQRMKMQILIYLLQEAGIAIGNCHFYNFHWYSYGLHSEQLQNDIFSITACTNQSIHYSKTAKVIIRNLKNILNNNLLYRDDMWVECLGSLQYLRSNMCANNVSNEEVIQKLQERKPHLNDKNANIYALDKLKSFYK